ncbi:MAG: 50S ribosomal protein L18 [Candidatus Staskawiczbacteria bacterium CG10_big_fil_rev_8_21_14_0_10_38_10]|uniref:Large ribosomal subunit protein uL18 n=1 Tax=Candidatus Staskawiczbacteria bacterium CG10_big_fil_rev_8_21_14_0_10_38_10 TaxID=1974891 RepID=A0A2H9T252_9BACT|nr:MAG: 50S ribosomal protein L18 [Candidatus Staskawiczbacteria bacterium CG10_big_fil_rev_8_21_14_0_10_38_10]
MKKNIKQERRKRRHQKIRVKIKGTKKRPRLCVFRSAKHIYAQLIDDEKGQTIITASDLELKQTKTRSVKAAKTPADKEKKELSGKLKVAYEVGKLTAEKAAKEKIENAVFDRGGFVYHGRIKALAEGVRDGGLKI